MSGPHEIYYSFCSQPLPAPLFTKLMQLLPHDMQQKAYAYKRWQDAHKFVLGKHLLLHALKHHKSTKALSDIRYSDLKRPSIDGFKDFSISHAGDLVICGISGGGKIGVDVEYRLPLELSNFNNQFSAAEWNSIYGDASPLDVFYDYWTAKEAILKGDGCGLIDNLPSLEVHKGKRVLFREQTWHLQNVQVFEGYSCHIASDEPGRGYILTKLLGDQIYPGG